LVGCRHGVGEKAVDDRDHVRTVRASKKSIYLYKNIELTSESESEERAPGTELRSTADKDANAKTNFIIVAVVEMFTTSNYVCVRSGRNETKTLQLIEREHKRAATWRILGRVSNITLLIRFVRRDNLRLFYWKNEDRHAYLLLQIL